ncbi:tetratricopeptide repeat protein [Amycolatopsis alba]|uniref:Tetratricopeptide repeat-containing protein n=1 Tax=Amycolatopsis alba DSM 44262 TaxID=1125972 RepID=A0A229REY3_AMYAL|nr:tetratricopeptide repeat protein [Amycolatopsis alba]OXM45232.1 tetratricopeptide repeat-containing protein [Amycolatopsis alba DSM 44262]
MTGGDAYEGDVTEHPATDVIFQAWHAEPGARKEFLESLNPPGAIALRSRYRHLLDSLSTEIRIDPVPPEQWRRALLLETEIDQELRTGHFKSAEQLCGQLADDTFGEIAVVNAMIGLGDARRSVQDPDRALEHYEAATIRADASGYRFGRVRSLIPLGYLTLTYHSAVRATDLFEEAKKLAEDLADPVYLGNAIQGLAECADRRGDTATAMRHYQKAFAVFTEIRTATGQAHAAQRLGTLYNRVGRPVDARKWLVRAAESFAADGDKVGTVNVLEDLGDFLLGLGDPDAAEIQFRAAHDIAAQHGLTGAKAHAIQNYGRLARARESWPQAVELFEQAVTAYRAVGDLLGVCTALTRLAESRERLAQEEGGDSGLLDRVAAVYAIEQYRAANHDPAAQHEYRRRFAEIYAQALRAAVARGSAPVFAVVADGLAGRRLAGLAGAEIRPGVTDDLTILQHVLVSADQRWLSLSRPTGTSGMELPPETTRTERIARLMGTLAIKGGTREPAKTAVDDLLAAVYPPQEDDGDELLSHLPATCDVLQLALDPACPELLHRLWRNDKGETHLDTVRLPQDCTKLLELLQEDSQERSDLRLNEMIGLAELLPSGLRERLSQQTGRLLILPVGELWLVPWSAVPIRPGLPLGQASEYAVCPSLGVQRILRERAPRASRGTSYFWANPMMAELKLGSLLVDPQWRIERVGSAQEAKTRLTDGAHTVICVGHGRLSDGIGHYLELDINTWLLPVDVLTGTPPERLCLITCWGGGVPGQAMTDPVTVATLALVRGSLEVLATVGEYGDTPVGNQFAQWVVASLGTTGISVSRAVHTAINRVMTEPGIGAYPIRDWAPLLPIGTFRD